jgi:hypothetical protein
MVAALAAIAPATATAHNASYSTQHAISLGSAGFAGKLTSPSPDCVSARAITLYREDTSRAVAVASATSDTQGAWTRSADTLKPGAYYALAARVVKTSAGHKHTCEAARSDPLPLAPDSDGDGIRDPYDNCPTPANTAQQDRDGDGTGDACDADADGDGYTADLGDCDDAHIGVNPGAAEGDNGIDDDCDGTVDEGFGTLHSCWVPSSEPVVATSSWSQSQTTEPCTYQLTVYSSVLPSSVFMVSREWMIEYRAAGAGGPIAFHHDGQEWTYYATHANAVVCTCDPVSDEGGEGL